MKTFNLTRTHKFMLVALCAVVSALLFLFGHSQDSGHLVTATAGAAITLTEEEKTGFSESEQKVVLAMKKMLAMKNEDLTKGLSTSAEVTSAIKEMKEGLTNGEIKGLKAEIDKLEGALKTQGDALNALKEKGGADEVLSLEKALKENMETLQGYRNQKSGAKTFYFGEYEPKTDSEKASTVSGIKTIFQKDAVLMTQAATTSSYPTNVTNPYSPFPTQINDIVFIRRNPNLALTFVDKGTTNSSVMTWTEEVGEEGAVGIVTEGSLKNQVSFTFQDKITKAKKAAAYFKITDEMETNIPRLATAIRRLFENKVMRAYDDLIYADILSVVGGYTLTALDDKIDGADDYAAIGAAICQIETLNGNADLIVLNPADRWRMRLTKGNDGHYVTPPFSVGDRSFDGIRVIISNKVAAGNFLVGESQTWKVDEYKPYSLTIGWVNDDLIRNQYTAVGEVWFHSYIAASEIPFWVYASFDTVKASIEAPGGLS